MEPSSHLFKLKLNNMKALTIEIFESSQEEGYVYNIYDCGIGEIADQLCGDTSNIDGGMCTGSLVDALEMATEQAGFFAAKSDEEDKNREKFKQCISPEHHIARGEEFCNGSCFLNVRGEGDDDL